LICHVMDDLSERLRAIRQRHGPEIRIEQGVELRIRVPIRVSIAGDTEIVAGQPGLSAVQIWGYSRTVAPSPRSLDTMMRRFTLPELAAGLGPAPLARASQPFWLLSHKGVVRKAATASPDVLQ
jgi:hypothetical protein